MYLNLQALFRYFKFNFTKMKSNFFVQRERRVLQNKRLDLDAAKNRLKRARTLEAQATVSFARGRNSLYFGLKIRI